MPALDGIEEGKAIDLYRKSMTITPQTFARMAGNIAAGLVAPQFAQAGAVTVVGADYQTDAATVANRAIEIAHEIASQLKMTVADPVFHEK